MPDSLQSGVKKHLDTRIHCILEEHPEPLLRIPGRNFRQVMAKISGRSGLTPGGRRY